MADRSTKILLVHDEPGIQRILRAFLSIQGYQPFSAATGAEGLRTFFAFQPDLILLSPLLPDLAGHEFCQRIHRCADTPVLLFGEQISELRYQELQQQIVNHTYRTYNDPMVQRVLTMLPELHVCPHTQEKKSSTGNRSRLQLDSTHYQVITEQKKITLTVVEYRLLHILMQNSGAIVSVKHILEQVWGAEYLGCEHYVHHYVWRLRRKIEKDPDNPHLILREYGAGYRLVNS